MKADMTEKKIFLSFSGWEDLTSTDKIMEKLCFDEISKKKEVWIKCDLSRNC